jgi:predicted nucleic acid-binding protein
MKNLTLSADDELIEKARREAARRGKSLNQLIRDYLEELAGERSPATSEFDRLRELSVLALWDAMIVHMADRADCAVLFSEDLQAGRHICGVEIVDPFRG